MKIVKTLKEFLHRLRPRPLGEWFRVILDDDGVRFDVEPPGKDSWEDRFNWASVQRICFKDEGLYASDVYYVFTHERPEAYVVPSEAAGGQAFVEEMLKRELSDQKLFIKAMGETDGGTYCWPLMDQRCDS